MESVLITIFFGYLLILVEGFLPGGIFGLFGAVCILIASYFAYSNLGGIVPSLITFLLSSAGGLLILFLQFKWLSKSKLGSTFFLSKKNEGLSNENLPTSEIIGCEGKALTAHKPEGIVWLNGKNYDSFCEDGLLQAGKKVIVVGIDDFRIRVRKKI